MTFTELGVPDALVAALAKQEITTPTAVQAAALPWLLEGKDAYLYAPTGTGKTLAYLLPVFARIAPATDATQALILAPTHELAIQIQRVCGDLASGAGWPLRSILLVGGTMLERQVEKLRKRPHVAIGTLGRVEELICMGKLRTDALKVVVVDEADRMWVPTNDRALKALLAPGRQLICASATIPAEDAGIPDLEVLQGGEEPVNENIEHFYVVCEERDKQTVLRKLLHALAPTRAMVFVTKADEVDPVVARLKHHKVQAVALEASGDKFARKRAMDAFRAGQVTLMVASDVAARGLDIAGVSHVINLDAPSQSMAYLHRVGRSARGSSHGQAVTLVTEGELNRIRRYESELGVELQAMRLREGRMVPEEHRERRSR